jgi:hypothetical protein
MMMNTALCHTTKDGKPFVKKVGRAETVLLENTVYGYNVYIDETVFPVYDDDPCDVPRVIAEHSKVLSRPPSK